MGIKEDIEPLLKEREMTPIQGQPTDRSLTQLTRELTKIAASFSTGLVGGNNGHAGIIVKRDKYVTVLHNAEEFTIPTHPGSYPLNALDDPKERAKEEAEHESKRKEYETCSRVVQA